MAELHSDIYFKHTDPEVMEALDAMLDGVNEDLDRFSSLAETINPTDGKRLANELISLFSDPKYDLFPESLAKAEGYSVCHFVHGSGGDELISEIMKFLYSLCPAIHAQAWGHGDDDPWEYWIKFEDGLTKRKDDEPTFDSISDQKIVDSVYVWWHRTLPDGIRAGLIDAGNDDRRAAEDAIDIEGKHVVFTGKMESGTREEMERSAVDRGAIVQKSVNSKTQILVVGANPGASKLRKAEELDLEIVSETDFGPALRGLNREQTKTPVRQFEKPQFRRSPPNRSRAVRKTRRRWR